MIRLISFLFTGCWHKWAVFRTGPVRPQGDWFYLRCEKCGNLKSKWLD